MLDCGTNYTGAEGRCSLEVGDASHGLATVGRVSERENLLSAKSLMANCGSC